MTRAESRALQLSACRSNFLSTLLTLRYGYTIRCNNIAEAVRCSSLRTFISRFDIGGVVRNCVQCAERLLGKKFSESVCVYCLLREVIRGDEIASENYAC